MTRRYGLSELKLVYGFELAGYLEAPTGVSIFHAALMLEHGWLAVAAYRVLIRSLDYVCSRSARALPMTIKLFEEFLQGLLLNSS
jgi:hypothetical protein